jgi:Tfp pilus assembly protein PilV
LALGVIVVGLLNVAKMLVRSSARRHQAAASTRGQVLTLSRSEVVLADDLSVERTARAPEPVSGSFDSCDDECDGEMSGGFSSDR